MRESPVMSLFEVIESHLHGDVGVDKLHLPLAEPLLLGVDSMKVAIDQTETLAVDLGLAVQLADGMPGTGQIPVQALNLLAGFVFALVHRLFQLADPRYKFVVPVNSTFKGLDALAQQLSV